MILFAEFFTVSAIDNEKIVEACGDRSVVVLDGRMRFSTHRSICIDWCSKHNFIAYRICKGESILRVHTRSEIYEVNNGN